MPSVFITDSVIRGSAESTAAQQLFHGSIRFLVVDVFATPRGDAQQLPVGRAITRAPEASWIDKGLSQVDRMPIQLFPVARQDISPCGPECAKPDAAP